MKNKLPYRESIIKINEEELGRIVNLNDIINKNNSNIVDLLLKLDEEKSMASQIKVSDKEFKKLLNKKYGDVNIDLSTGYFCPMNVDIEPEIDMEKLEKVDQPKFEALSKTNKRKLN
tara:strand:+ start:127 stop:477 length:351 start_codon:yes stop_codon:yes gene_type:complete